LFAAIGGTVIHYDDLQGLSALGFLQALQAAPQPGNAVARNHNHGDARRRRRLRCDEMYRRSKNQSRPHPRSHQSKGLRKALR